MSEVSFKTEPGVTYYLIDGVPYRLVTETQQTDVGWKTIMKYVPAKRIYPKPRPKPKGKNDKT